MWRAEMGRILVLMDWVYRVNVVDVMCFRLAFQALQSMLVDLPHWRNSIVRGEGWCLTGLVIFFFKLRQEIKILRNVEIWSKSNH